MTISPSPVLRNQKIKTPIVEIIKVMIIIVIIIIILKIKEKKKKMKRFRSAIELS